MSVWTHVAGIVRVDDMRPLIGHNLAYVLHHFQSFVPGGSEGPLDVWGWENPHVSSLSSYAVSVFGDLRDYDDPQLVANWFDERVQKLPVPLMVRQGIATIWTEGREPIVWYPQDRTAATKTTRKFAVQVFVSKPRVIEVDAADEEDARKQAVEAARIFGEEVVGNIPGFTVFPMGDETRKP